MASFTSLLFIVACAVLLQVLCEARRDRNRQQWGPSAKLRESASISVKLGCNCDRSWPLADDNIIVIPPTNIAGPDAEIEGTDLCGASGMKARCTELIFTNYDGGPAPDVNAYYSWDPLSNVEMHCVLEWYKGSYQKCPEGVTVTGRQICV